MAEPQGADATAVMPSSPPVGTIECEEAAASGEADNVVVNAPHTAAEICGEWSHPYTREKAAFPLEFIRESKFFPYVSKIDNGYGDRNLVCRCTE